MKDILGRELHDGDIVVTKGNQATGDKGAMAIGVFRNKSVRVVGGKWRTAKDMFLVQNPTPVEEGIKAVILREIELEKAETEIKRRKTANQLADQIGTLYLCADGRCYLYCGWMRVETEQDGKKEEQTGHVYIPVWYGRDGFIPAHLQPLTLNWKGIQYYINAKNITAVKNLKILKNFSKYQKIFPQYHDINVPDEFCFDCPALHWTVKFTRTK